MFNNVMELIDLIDNGIGNEEIINERLKYLNSEDYRSKRKSTITLGHETNAILFHDGFIPKDMPIGLQIHESSNCYTINNINDVYEDVINYIRENKETIKKRNGIAIKYVGEIIKSYFRIPHQKSDKEAVEMFKQEWIKYFKSRLNSSEYTDEDINKKAQLQVRNQIGSIVGTWKDAVKANLFKGSFKDYMMVYLYNREERSRLSKEIIAWRESQQYEVEKNVFLGTTIDISEISGYNMGKCTEHAMVTQNVLSFLGYESFMVAGKLKSNDNVEAHNFNVVKKNGKYYIIDTVNRIYNKQIEAIDNKESERLINFGEYSMIHANGETIKYCSQYPSLTKGENLSDHKKNSNEQEIELE